MSGGEIWYGVSDIMAGRSELDTRRPQTFFKVSDFKIGGLGIFFDKFASHVLKCIFFCVRARAYICMVWVRKAGAALSYLAFWASEMKKKMGQIGRDFATINDSLFYHRAWMKTTTTRGNEKLYGICFFSKLSPMKYVHPSQMTPFTPQHGPLNEKTISEWL